MSEPFMHIGKFAVASESRDAFLDVMATYQKEADQTGLEHSNIIEDEKAAGTFMHVTLWKTREDWAAVEKSAVHQSMHKKRDALLVKPMEHDFVCGMVRL